MRSVLAITVLTFREALRSRLVAALAAAVALAVFGLPGLMKGDGTGAGLAKTAALYSLSVAFAVLAISAIVSSASAISSEAKGRTLQLARVKPLRMWKLWLGKWIGLVTIYAALLAFALLGTWLGLRRVPELAIASEKVSPVLPSLESQVEAVMKKAVAAGETDKARLAAIRREARAQLPFATLSLQPGREWHWRFALPDGAAIGEKVGLLLVFQADSFSPKSPSARCYLRADRADDASPPPVVFAIDDLSTREMRLSFDSGALAGATAVELAMLHTGQKESGPILIQPRQGLFLMRPATPLLANCLRAFLVLLPILALLVATGLALGALFSLPVAVFCAAGLTISVFAADYAAGDPDVLDFSDDIDPSPLRVLNERLSIATTHALQFVAATAIRPAPVSEFTDGERIPPREIGMSVVWNGLAIPALLMALSSVAMAQKELPE